MRHKYKTEAELCDAFAEAAKIDSWLVYPECGNFDLLLVKDGIQVGVEAKLRCNLEVLEQAIRYNDYGTRPTYVGVLVPSASEAMEAVSQKLRVHVWDHSYIHTRHYQDKHGGAHPGLCLRQAWAVEATRVKLPEVAVQTSGGRPSPKVMSEWRVKALRVCLILERQGYLTREDIKGCGVDSTRWTQYWLQTDGKTRGSRGRPVTKYVPKIGVPFPPSAGYEEELAALRALGTR